MKKTFYLILVFLILLAFNVNAFGIRPAFGYPEYKLGETTSGSFKIVNNEGETLVLDLFVEGDLQEFIELSKDTIIVPKDGEVSLEYFIEINEPLKPGEYKSKIILQQHAPEGSAIKIRLVLDYNIILNVPYPDKYIEASITAKIKDDDVFFYIPVTNPGNLDLEDVNIEVELLDDQWYVTSFETGDFSINPGETKNIEIKMSGDEVLPGEYNAIIKMYYDGEFRQENVTLFVGSPAIGMYLSDIPFTESTISKFEICLENLWNKPFSNVYAEINISDEYYVIKSVKTYSIDLKPRERQCLHAYFDPESLPYGDYSAAISVNSDGYFTSKIFNVQIVTEEEYRKIMVGKQSWIFKISFIVMIVILLVVLYLLINKFNKSGR
ncbi:hypothetical protein KY330_03440 [Candidatus Woesearchaeota archaeon]|nr:hypothetical protein [Candidatus Woesearchaeota archaeon]